MSVNRKMRYNEALKNTDPIQALEKLGRAETLLNVMFPERSREIRGILRAMIGFTNVLFLSPPGTGKTLLARKALELIKVTQEDRLIPFKLGLPRYKGKRVAWSQVLMSPQTTLEDWMGALNLKEFKEQGTYNRDMNGQLVGAFGAIVDEIFKGGRGNNNPMLSVLHPKERTVYINRVKKGKNAREAIKCNIRMIIAASNEEYEDPSLEAFDSRLIQRFEVAPLTAIDNKRRIMGIDNYRVEITKHSAYKAYWDDPISLMDLFAAHDFVKANVVVPKEIASTLCRFQKDLAQPDRLGFTFDDRKLVEIGGDCPNGEFQASVIKCEAFLNGSVKNGTIQATASDLKEVLYDTAWDHRDNRRAVWNAIDELIKIPTEEIAILIKEMEDTYMKIDNELRATKPNMAITKSLLTDLMGKKTLIAEITTDNPSTDPTVLQRYAEATVEAQKLYDEAIERNREAFKNITS